MLREDYVLALDYLKKADESAKGRILNTDQRLSLWIQKSECYRQLRDYDQAMRLLSQVVNEDAVSGLRVKAMLLRAEIYALQGRHELARKQLEATSSKGGEWGKTAKKILVEDYGYH